MTVDTVGAVFERAGCTGTLLVQPLDGEGEFGLGADQLVVPASVVKVLVALAAETWFAEGRLDPRERVVLGAAERTPGTVGVSLFEDEVALSLRDMVVLMLTISDNPCTDALMNRLGVDTLNATAARLGLRNTVVRSDLRTMLDSIGQDLVDWSGRASAAESAGADEKLPGVRALTPGAGTSTTARDMVRLLRLLWSGQAGPAAACARVRAVMGRQLTRHRIASGFRTPVRVAVTRGGRAGIVGNEVGGVSYPDGRQYAAAVFTRSRPGADDAAINAAIGAATAHAVASLHRETA